MTDIPMSTLMRRIPGWRQIDTGVTPTLIELTAKKWKALRVVSFAAAAIGIAFLGWQAWTGLYRPIIDSGYGAQTELSALLAGAFSGPAGITGILIFAFALGLGLYARFMAWWRHG